jgi:deazaflavin-dependent oxidoreductase (nitroreductase family)
VARTVLNDELGEQLAGWGKVVTIETRGRVTGRRVEVAVGYVDAPDDIVLVAAGSPESDWARNLLADPACQVRLEAETWPAEAELVDGPDAARAIAALILKYGTPAERLGRGPVFRLRRVDQPR